MLTTLCSLFKSSTKDLSFPIFEITIQQTLMPTYLTSTTGRCNFMMLGTQKRTYRYSRNIGKGVYRSFQHGF